MISDFKYALRTLTKTPGFTIIAVITLALAIGANTTIFSLINDLFLRSLSFKEPRRVVHFLSNAPDRKLVDLPLSLPRFQHYRAGQTMCEDLAAENVFAFTLTGLGDAVQLFGGRVTSNYFDVLGLRPIRGRNFLPNEEEAVDATLGDGRRGGRLPLAVRTARECQKWDRAEVLERSLHVAVIEAHEDLLDLRALSRLRLEAPGGPEDAEQDVVRRGARSRRKQQSERDQKGGSFHRLSVGRL